MTTHFAVYALCGMAMIIGFKHMWRQTLIVIANLMTPRPQPVRQPQPAPDPFAWRPQRPVYERDYCIGCGRLVRCESMSWAGSRFLCPGCVDKEEV